MFALVDGNSFYASCEQVFRPDLADRPIIVLSISELPEPEQDELLSRMAVSDVWGVGRQWLQRLQSTGIETALDLKRCTPKKIRQQYNVILEKTVHELNGIPCQDLELIQPDKKEIVSSRAFSQPITDYQDMKQARSNYFQVYKLKDCNQIIPIIRLYN